MFEITANWYDPSLSVDPFHDLVIGVPFALLMLYGGVRLGRAMLPRDVPSMVWKIFLAAIALRALAVPVLHFTGLSLAFGPDEKSFNVVGSQMARHWQGLEPFPYRADYSAERFFFYVNGLVYYLAGYVKFLPKYINVIVGGVTTIYTYKIARALFNHESGVIAMASVAFLPSLVLWSSLNIRDPWAFLAVTAIVWELIRLRHRVSLGPIVAVLVWLAILFNLRQPTAIIVVGSLGMSFVVARREHIHRNIVVGLTLCVMLLLGFHFLGFSSRHLTASPAEALQTMDAIHQELSKGSGAYGGEGEDISTATGALTWLPKGLTFFLLGPLPWQAETPLQLTALPETLIWYYLLYHAMIGLGFVIRHGRIDAWLLVLLAINLTLIFSLVEGNVGTAFRHRAQVLPLYLILASLGIYLRRAPRPGPPLLRPHPSRLRSHSA